MIDPEEYFEEFIRYHEMAKIQMHECNLGTTPHLEGKIQDNLMMCVELYDVTERKYAGFTQIILDLWYGYTEEHPYWEKLHDVRKPIARSFTGVHHYWGLSEWLYIFILHRVTGSGINYAKKPSGYNNTILPKLMFAQTFDEIVNYTARTLQGDTPAYTSVGYQFPRFPPKEGFKRGGDRYLFEYAPKLARELAEYLCSGSKKELREVGEWMFDWNKRHGLTAYRFQYAAVISDIADFYPDLVDRHSMFYYGSNAVECISYMTGGKKAEKHLDAVMERAMKITGNVPYNLEDVACDFIRWVENYIKPGHDYDHLDRDLIWNTSTITHHPYGRQKAMLDLGLIQSFNALDHHPSDDWVLRNAGLNKEAYWDKIILT